ncbi:MAG: DNA-binding protein [Bacteroidaceae bacterium]|nr:DNA-binding protein [Bacteroidaceae bacterium]
MALKVKAVERLLKFTKDENDPGVYRYVMKADLYTSLSQAKVIREAALRSGVSQGVMKACWDAAGEVIKAWATEGHSVALPGLGSMRFGLRSKAVEDVNDVKTSLIESRRIIFTPSVDLKDELANTSIQITCIDRNGKEVKRVTSTSGDVEDPEGGDDNGGGSNENENQNQSGGGSGNGGNDDPDNGME